jgi:SAM-dependent methyltransferase
MSSFTTAATAAPPSSTTTGWQVGDRVLVDFREEGEGFPGAIDCINEDGTFDISYDDESSEYYVKPKSILGKAGPKVEEASSEEDNCYRTREEIWEDMYGTPAPATTTTTAAPPAIAKDIEEQQEEPQEEQKEFESASFWVDFYKDLDGELYDWYSTEDWLPSAVEVVAVCQIADTSPANGALSVLDVGCGTCPLLLDLAKRAFVAAASTATTSPTTSPTTTILPRWNRLVGVDFAASAMDIMNEYAANTNTELAALVSHHPNPSLFPSLPTILFGVADARALCRDVLEQLQQQTFDILVDKGCLDCFVTGSGDLDIEEYFRQVHACLAPGGRWVLVPVNGSDIVKLLESGGKIIQHDSRSVGGGEAAHAARAAKWAAEKRKHRHGKEEEQDPDKECELVLECIRAYQSKHVHVVRKRQDPPLQWVGGGKNAAPDNSGSGASGSSGSSGSSGVPVICGDCETAWVWPDFPARCACGNQIQRFALS